MPCHVISCHAISCHLMPSHVKSRHATSRLPISPPLTSGSARSEAGTHWPCCHDWSCTMRHDAARAGTKHPRRYGTARQKTTKEGRGDLDLASTAVSWRVAFFAGVTRGPPKSVRRGRGGKNSPTKTRRKKNHLTTVQQRQGYVRGIRLPFGVRYKSLRRRHTHANANSVWSIYKHKAGSPHEPSPVPGERFASVGSGPPPPPPLPRPPLPLPPRLPRCLCVCCLCLCCGDSRGTAERGGSPPPARPAGSGWE